MKVYLKSAYLKPVRVSSREIMEPIPRIYITDRN